jgi:hypothetical protein
LLKNLPVVDHTSANSYVKLTIVSFVLYQTIVMQKLENYVSGSWLTGDGDGQVLYNAINGEGIAVATTKG